MVCKSLVVGALFLSCTLSQGCAHPSVSNPNASSVQTQPRTRPTFAPLGQCKNTPSQVSDDFEVVDDSAVVTLSADAFIDLEPSERVVAYHLSQAVIAVDPIIYAQRSRFGLTIKALAEELSLHRDAIEKPLRDKFDTFAFRVFVNKGIHDAYTQRKIAPPFSPEELRKAVVAIVDDGAKLEGIDEIEDYLKRLHAPLFDSKFEPVARRTMDGKVRLKARLEHVVSSLREAVKMAKGEQRVSISKLIEHIEATQRQPAYKEHLQASPSVALRIGELQGEAFGALLIADKELQPRLDRLHKEWSALQSLIGSSAATHLRPRAGVPLMLSGAMQFTTPVVASLSNAPRQVWVHSTVLDAAADLYAQAILRGFVPKSKQTGRFGRCLPHAFRSRMILRETIGRSVVPELPSSNRDHDVIRRAIAELSAVVLAWDQRIVGLGLLPESGCSGVVDELVEIDHLYQLRTISTGVKIVDPSIRASSLVVQYLMGAGVVRQVRSSENVQFEIDDRTKWRAEVKALLSQLIAIETNKNDAQARKLVEKFATNLKPAWRKFAVAQARGRIPKRLVFVSPRSAH